MAIKQVKWQPSSELRKKEHQRECAAIHSPCGTPYAAVLSSVCFCRRDLIGKTHPSQANRRLAWDNCQKHLDTKDHGDTVHVEILQLHSRNEELIAKICKPNNEIHRDENMPVLAGAPARGGSAYEHFISRDFSGYVANGPKCREREKV